MILIMLRIRGLTCECFPTSLVVIYIFERPRNRSHSAAARIECSAYQHMSLFYVSPIILPLKELSAIDINYDRESTGRSYYWVVHSSLASLGLEINKVPMFLQNKNSKVTSQAIYNTQLHSTVDFCRQSKTLEKK